MTSEDMAASVLPLIEGKVISTLSATDENSLDSGVIKRHTMGREQEKSDTVSYLGRLKGHGLQNSVTKTFSLASKEENRENVGSRDVLERSACIPHSVEYLNINCKILERACTANLRINQLCKSYDPLKGSVEPRIPAMLTEINFKMDRSSMDRVALKSPLIVNDHCTDAVGHIPALRVSCSTEKTLSNTLYTTNDGFILGNGLPTGRKNNSDNYAECSCKLNEQLSESCSGEDEKPVLNCEQCCRLNIKSTSKVEKPLLLSGNRVYGQTVPCTMSSKPLQSRVEEFSRSCEGGTESDFSRNKKDRSTLLIRRFCKNYKEVKKSVYTGTKAIVNTFPSGHIGTKAWCHVEKKQESTSDLKCLWFTTEHLTTVNSSIRRKDFLYYLVKSIAGQCVVSGQMSVTCLVQISSCDSCVFVAYA